MHHHPLSNFVAMTSFGRASLYTDTLVKPRPIRNHIAPNASAGKRPRKMRLRIVKPDLRFLVVNVFGVAASVAAARVEQCGTVERRMGTPTFKAR